MGLLAAGTHSALWSWRWPSALWQPLERLQGPRRSHWAEPVRNREITFIMGQSKWFRKEPSPSGKQGLLGVSQHNRWLRWRCSHGSARQEKASGNKVFPKVLISVNTSWLWEDSLSAVHVKLLPLMVPSIEMRASTNKITRCDYLRWFLRRDCTFVLDKYFRSHCSAFTQWM